MYSRSFCVVLQADYLFFSMNILRIKLCQHLRRGRLTDLLFRGPWHKTKTEKQKQVHAPLMMGITTMSAKSAFHFIFIYLGTVDLGTVVG